MLCNDRGCAYPSGVADAPAARKCDVPHLLKALLEGMAAELELVPGRWRLELVFEEGLLRESYRHDERLPSDKLFERFPAAHHRLARLVEDLPECPVWVREMPLFDRLLKEARRGKN